MQLRCAKIDMLLSL